MKPLLLLSASCLLAIAGTAQPYCTPSPTFDEHKITNVTLGAIDHDTDWDGYSDYTHLKAVLDTGEINISFTIEGETINWLADVYVYIDWNQDSVFDGTESYFYAQGMPKVDTIPEGEYRLRVIVAAHDDHHGVPAPCLTQSGEAEDYTLVIGTPASVAEPSVSTQLKVYPNPGNGVFYLETAEKVRKIQIVDIAGKLWYSESPNIVNARYKLDLSSLPKGVYLLHAENGRTRKTQRLVIR